jgi:hypothetical protein
MAVEKVMEAKLSPPRSSSAEALPESYEFWERVSAWVPQVYRYPGLSGFPRHYLGVDELPIIVCYPITSLMLFMHLDIVWWNQILPCCIYGPVSGGSSMQCDPMWRLYRHLGGLPSDVRQRKVLDIAIDEVSGALSMHAEPLAIRSVVVPAGVTVLWELHNPQCSKANTVGPSLPDFTISPYVDFLPCYRSIRQPKSVLQDNPEV